MIKRLSKNLVEEMLILEPLESAMNIYWKMRLGERSHDDAYKVAELIEREECHTFICTSRVYDNELTASVQHRFTIMSKTWFIDKYHEFDLEQN